MVEIWSQEGIWCWRYQHSIAHPMTKLAIPINTTNNTFHALQTYMGIPFPLSERLLYRGHLHDQAKFCKRALTYIHVCVQFYGFVDNKWSKGLNKKKWYLSLTISLGWWVDGFFLPCGIFFGKSCSYNCCTHLKCTFDAMGKGCNIHTSHNHS